nr:hypothetical protein [Tanacetum cinerariifolium]
MEDLKQQYLDELHRLSNLEYRNEIKIAELKENFNGMSIEIQKKEMLLQEEQWAYLSIHPFKRLPYFCFDDDDEDYTSAITPDEHVLYTEEPDKSLSMGDEHLDTIPATESDEFIKSGVENLIPIPKLVDQRLRKTLTHVLELSSCIYLDDRARDRINLRRTFVAGFPAQSNSSSNAIALDSPYLLVLNTKASQSRQH